jgi:hypothetical protein|uniref:Uncharacterized protein n=1 Tax=Siphoviridae sp. ctGyV19 TaxID=2826225 RepID=A0A8S5MUR2_9CAUD|nr:MAG TPA: hypothetical protein [Siphoviridae sp. ctGyV19]
MILNGSGCPDPVYEQALPAIRREENIRAREKRYGVHRGEVIYIILETKDERHRTVKVRRRMQVVDLCEHHIVLRHKTGACESYQYDVFMQMWGRR